ncbi:hypothetical protein BEP19_16675 [Ammoniphilus oxalaticus]|uniref:Peptidyl-prolyl cis-trans isomerase n=1 Tax=Ammoniphilus oxalaticus TaxID=66863 RepID=A0A419SQZ5_9BACL|nr:peptidylprolyl isomerase [Ammoniphilus oxalaticus]RKD26825.1 hypothetical protein BEP19_16675 [Ammoniphilus oxalaticus]
MIKKLSLLLLTLGLLTACGGAKEKVEEDIITDPNRGETSTKSWDTPPEMAIETGQKLKAIIETSKGDMKVELFADDAPKTVNNFVFLAKEDFYNNVVFHRIMKDFMIQTGDPTGTGMGGPGYTFEDELPSPYSYDKGIVAMANAGANTNSSQFFICSGPDCARSLNPNPNYTIFGRVIEGEDVLDQLASTPVKAGPTGEPSQPTEEVYIKQIVIEEE